MDVATGAAVANNNAVGTVVSPSSTKDKGRTAAAAKLPPPRLLHQAPPFALAARHDTDKNYVCRVPCAASAFAARGTRHTFGTRLIRKALSTCMGNSNTQISRHGGRV